MRKTKIIGRTGGDLMPMEFPQMEWSENKNIQWKIEIPGFGHATPIVWGKQMFVQTTIDRTKVPEARENKQQDGRLRARGISNLHQFVVLSIHRENGKILWQQVVKEEIPQEKTHGTGSWTSNSPVTDGKFIYAYFGSRGLFCLDMKGNIKWERDFGQMEKRMEFGECSSPVLYKDKIVVLWDHEGESFIVALDKNTGKDVWRTEREEGTTWSTPYIKYEGKVR